MAMNRSLAAPSDAPITYTTLHMLSSFGRFCCKVIIVPYTARIASPMMNTSEDATMLVRINLNVDGMSFSLMMGTNRIRLITNTTVVENGKNAVRP